MNTTTHLGHVGGIAVERRSFLGMVAAGAAVVGVPSLLTGCSSSEAGVTAEPGATAGADVLPTYQEIVFAEPDFPSVNGSTAGYTSIPDELVQSRGTSTTKPSTRRSARRSRSTSPTATTTARCSRPHCPPRTTCPTG
jgi:hypothetical protein